MGDERWQKPFSQDGYSTISKDSASYVVTADGMSTYPSVHINRESRDDCAGPGSSLLSSMYVDIKKTDFVNLDDKYICIECHEVLVDAMQTPCGHRICSPCAGKLVSNGRAVQCPANEDECVRLTAADITRDTGARREVRRLFVYCLNKKHGCQDIVTLENREAHLGVCEFRAVKCPNEGCSVSLPKDRLIHHHNDCPYAITSCPNCSEQLLGINLQEHIDNECTKCIEQCPNNCGSFLRKYELPDHQDVCPKGVNACKYSQVGCSFKGLKDDLESHYEEYQSKHLELSTFRAASLDLQSLTNRRRIKELESENTTIKAALDDVVKKNTDLSATTDALKNTIREFKIKFVSLTERCINLERSAADKAEKRDVERIARDLVVVQGIQTQLLNREGGQSEITQATQMTSIDKTLGLHDVRLAEMDLRFQVLETVEYNAELMWKLTDYEKRKHEAKTGRTLSIYSQPFYTSRHGYKMCARLYLNGDGIGRGTHMSVYFVVMRGNFDDLLEWPFTKKVTITLLDQASRVNHLIETFYTDRNSSSFKKPNSEMNIASGCPLFISQSQLEKPSSPYLRNGTLYLKACVEDV